MGGGLAFQCCGGSLLLGDFGPSEGGFALGLKGLGALLSRVAAGRGLGRGGRHASHGDQGEWRSWGRARGAARERRAMAAEGAGKEP